MHLNDDVTSVGVRPTPLSDSGHQGYMAHAAGGVGTPTRVTSDWLNAVSDEIANVVLAAGETLDKTNNAQLLAAIQTIAGNAGAQGQLPAPSVTIAMTPGHTTTRISFSAGRARDSSNTNSMQLVAPISKDLTAAWTAGDGNGGRDTGALVNGQTWHCHVILNTTSGVVDALFSQSATAPTLPAGYTKFRRVGSILLDAAATTISPFVQKGDDFMLTPPRADYAAQTNGGGTPTLRRFSVPVGVKVKGYFSMQSNGTIDNNPYYSGVFDPDDGTPAAWGLSTQRAQIRRIAAQTPGGTQYAYGTVEFSEWSDANGHLYTFSSDASDVIAIKTRGWVDKRAA